MQIFGLNTLDLLLLVILLIGMLIGLMRGTIPQLISAVSIWLALVVTLWTYNIFSFRILQGLGLDEISSDTLAFLILLFVFFQAIRLVVKYLSTPPEAKRRKKKSQDDPLAVAAKSASERFIIGPLNMLGGMVMGIFLTTLWLAVILGVAQFIFQPTGITTAFARRMASQMASSTLVPIFNSVLWLLARSVSFFVPRDADIFRRVLEFISS